MTETNKHMPLAVEYMSVEEFRRIGYLQELNRAFLHPLGLALSVDVAADGTETLGKIWDCRDDKEGIYFADEVDLDDRARMVQALWDGREMDRAAALGYMVQPAGFECTCPPEEREGD